MDIVHSATTTDRWSTCTGTVVHSTWWFMGTVQHAFQPHKDGVLVGGVWLTVGDRSGSQMPGPILCPCLMAGLISTTLSKYCPLALLFKKSRVYYLGGGLNSFLLFISILAGKTYSIQDLYYIYFCWPRITALIFILFYLATNLWSDIFIWYVHKKYSIHGVVQWFWREFLYQRGHVNNKPFVYKNLIVLYVIQYCLKYVLFQLFVITGQAQTFSLPDTFCHRSAKLFPLEGQNWKWVVGEKKHCPIVLYCIKMQDGTKSFLTDWIPVQCVTCHHAQIMKNNE